MTVNQLPKGWQYYKLDKVARIIRGVSFNKSHRTLRERSNFVPFLRANNIDGELNTTTDVEWVSKNVVKPEQYLLTQDIVICTSSGSSSVVGKVARLKHSWNGTVGAFLGIVRTTNAHAAFVEAWLRSSLFRSWRDSRVQGVNIQNIRLSELANLLIPLPSIHEQQRIADAIDAAMTEAEAVARATEAQQVDLHRLEFRILEAAFRVPPLALEGGDAPAGWSWQLLTDVARLESGHTPSRRHPEWWGGETPWIALPDIRALDGRTAHETDETINDAGLANSSARLLPAGTVCLSRTASVGFVTVMGRPMATSQDFVNWVCGRSLRPWFLAYALMASRPWLRELASGAVHKTIYMPTLKALRICMPGIEEQSRVVARIECCRTELGAARDEAAAQRAAVERLPSAILTAAFEGRL
jgi:type I restriction enzyme, S subunit